MDGDSPASAASGPGAPLRGISFTVAPNPVSASSQLLLDVTDGTQEVRVTLHDVSGRVVAELREGILNAGLHEIPLFPKEKAVSLRRFGDRSGVYFVRVQTGQGNQATKLLVIE